MDPAEFDRLIARARNPRLIPGIDNYCDDRCPRCPFTERCLTYLDRQEIEAAPPDHAGGSVVAVIEQSLQRTIDMLGEVAKREGIDLVAVGEEEAGSSRDEAPHERDPLVVQAREYGQLSWRIAKALEPLVVARGDPLVIDAVETIGWFSSLISAKVFRAACGQAEPFSTDEEIQTDHDGSAKVALLGIAESRAAWGVLMEHGKATADGVPAHAVRMLEGMDETIRTRFPLALAFVRPGFDEPDIAAGAPATLPPFALRRGSIHNEGNEQ